MSSIFVCGYYQDTSFNIYDADGSTSHLPALYDITEKNQGNAFLVKYDLDGKAIWGARLGGNNSSEGYSVSTDSVGNVFIVGRYGDTSFNIYDSDGELSNIPALYKTTENNKGHVFLVKYNADGYALWGTRLGGNISSTGISVSNDSIGNVYITGSYRDTSFNIYNSDEQLSNVRALYNTTDGQGNNVVDIFIVKYNTDGYAQWATRMSASGPLPNSPPQVSLTNYIHVDSPGNIYISGGYVEEFNIYDSDGTYKHLPGLANTNGNVIDTFIVKYNTDGYALWGTRLGGNVGSFADLITTDNRGNIYVTGLYNDTAFNMYDSNGQLSNIPFPTLYDTTGNNGGNTFIVKYDTNGKAVWGTRLGGNTYSLGSGISIDNGGNVYVTGQYKDTFFNIYNSNGQLSNVPALYNTSGNNISETFLVKYDTDGKAIWGTQLGGNNNSLGSGISIDNGGNVYVTGQYQDTLFNIYDSNGQLSNVPALYDTTGNNGGDTFIVKYDANGKAQWGTRLGGDTNSQGFWITCFIPIQPIEPNICFPPGTLIFTDQGYRAIETILPGIHTIGKKEIVHVVKTKNREKRLVCFEKDALAKNCPNRDLCMSSDHKVLFQGKMVAAKYFVGHFDTKVKAVKYAGEYVYNILMEKHGIMTVHNCIVETLHPMNPVAQQYIHKKGKKERKNRIKQKKLNIVFNERL